MSVDGKVSRCLSPDNTCSATLLSLKPCYDPLPMNHPDALAPYPCLRCRRRCYTIQDLDLHARWHRRENECSLCRKTFASFDIFTAHVRKHYVDATKDYSVNNKIRDIPAPCKHCGENFTTVRNLQCHMQLFSDSYTTCQECDRYLPNCHTHHNSGVHGSPLLVTSNDETPRFRYELRAEPTLRPFQCDICSAKFGDSQRLLTHLNKHSSDHRLLYEGGCGGSRRVSRVKLRDSESAAAHSYGLSF